MALARQALAELRVLSARADQAEADLDFGLVDQLFRSAGGPVPAILPGAGPAASAFTVGAQLLQVVGELATAAPTVILVEDLQWADRNSLDALTFTEQADQELAACHLPRSRAAELFVSRKAVEYHLGNIYGKYGIHSRRELRRLVGQWRAAAVV